MNLLESPWNAVLAASLRGSALILCVLALRWLLRGRLPAGALHLLWLLVAVRLLMPVAPSSSWSVFNLAQRMPAEVVAADAGGQVKSFVEPAGAAPKAVVTASATFKKESWRTVEVLPWLWAAGVLVQVALLGWSALAVRRRLGGAAIIDDARFLRLAQECREQLGLRRPVAFLESADLAGPAVLGLWRPRLVMPPGLIARLSDEELRFVLLHELAHVRRHDLAALWLLTAARVLHWFNPLAWLAARVAHGDAELACDETVLRHAHGTAPTAYGAALLRLVQLAPWRPTAVPMAGIAERAGALKERLARIGDYAPGTVRRAVFTALVVLGVGVVFGADEKKDAVPVPGAQAAEPQAAPDVPKVGEKVEGELPAWAKGWIVASVTIPVDGDLKDASVDFQMPDGEPVTLIAGAKTKGGVVLSNIAWEGTPVRARVRLRHGREFADLFAAAALVAKSKVQKKTPGHIEIESRFIEVPEALALTLKDPAGNLLFPPAAKGGKPAPAGQIVGVLKAGEEQALFAKLNKLKGPDLLSAPKVTTKSGQRAVIEIIREFRYPTEWKEDPQQKGAWLPGEWKTVNVGVTLEVEPTIGVDETIDLQLVPQVVEYLGIVNSKTGKAATPISANERAGLPAPFPMSGPAGRWLRPVFSTRKVTTNVSIFSGNSVVVSGFGETEDTKPFKPKTPGRRLIVVITARQLTSK